MNNKGADQTAQMHRLVCPCVVRKHLKTNFFRVAAHLVVDKNICDVKKKEAIIKGFTGKTYCGSVKMYRSR